MRRAFLLVAAAVVMVSLALPAAPAAGRAQDAGTWTSPTYGFSVSWDPAIWEEEAAEGFVAQGPSSLDRLLLSGPGTLYVEGARAYDGVAGDCVRGELDTLAGDPSLNGVRQRDDLAADGPGASVGAFEATLTIEGGEPIRLVFYVECRSLSAEAVAVFTLVAPREFFFDARALAQEVIDTMALGSPADAGAAVVRIDAQSFDGWLALADGAAPAAGPLAGSLAVDPDAGTAALAAAGVFEADFIARLRWQNPAGAEPWDIGLAFRDQPDGSHYRLTVDAAGAWAFGIGTGEKIAGGDVPSMNLAPGAANVLELVASGNAAGFAVNGRFVAALDVSAIADPGDVTFGSGFVAANAAGGATVSFRDFAVWSLAGLSPVPPAAPEPPDAATPPAAPDLPPPPTPQIPDDPGASDGAARVVAVRVEAVADSGVSGLATLTEVDGEASLNLVLRGARGGELAVIHEGRCDDLAPDPAFLLEDADAGGRSRTLLGVPRDDLLAGDYAVAVHAGAEGFGDVVACGDIAG